MMTMTRCDVRCARGFTSSFVCGGRGDVGDVWFRYCFCSYALHRDSKSTARACVDVLASVHACTCLAWICIVPDQALLKLADQALAWQCRGILE